MNPRIYAPVLVSALLSVNALANVLEEVIVTSSLIDQTLSDIENPLHVVSGDDISATASQSLGESLDGLVRGFLSRLWFRRWPANYSWYVR